MAEDVQPTDENVVAVIEKSLPYLEAKGQYWIDEKKCVSCHRVDVMVWSFAEAKKRGIQYDYEKLDEWIDWSLNKMGVKDDEGISTGSKNIDGVSKILFGLQQSEVKNKSITSLANLIIDSQQEDGSWKPNGQLPGQKRPIEETTQVSTMWNLFALQSNSIPQKKLSPIQDKANAYLKNADPGLSTEWYALQLLLANGTQDQAKISTALEELRSLQKEDGGWGWLANEESDALATGISLYAMSVAGMTKDKTPMSKAIQFLISTQQADGSWKVKGTKEKKKATVQETATYWGTAWATIGLLQTLPSE